MNRIWIGVDVDVGVDEIGFMVNICEFFELGSNVVHIDMFVNEVFEFDEII